MNGKWELPLHAFQFYRKTITEAIQSSFINNKQPQHDFLDGLDRGTIWIGLEYLKLDGGSEGSLSWLMIVVKEQVKLSGLWLEGGDWGRCHNINQIKTNQFLF